MSKRARKSYEEIRCYRCRALLGYGDARSDVICTRCKKFEEETPAQVGVHTRWPKFNPDNADGVISRDRNYRFRFNVAPLNRLLTIVDGEVPFPEEFFESRGGHEFKCLQSRDDTERVARIYYHGEHQYLYVTKKARPVAKTKS